MGFTPESGVVLGDPVKRGYGVGAAELPPNPLQVYRLTLPAGGSGIWAVYSVWDTDHSELKTSPNWAPCTLSWESGHEYAAGNVTYMILGHRVIQGTPARSQEGHVHPDYGFVRLSKAGGTQQGVASFSLDWRDTGPHQHVHEPEDNFGQSPTPGSGNYHNTLYDYTTRTAMGSAWVWFWVRCQWGRLDDSTPVPGEIKIWEPDGTVLLNRTNVYTCWYQEEKVDFWQGVYHINGNSGPTAIVDYAAPRFGTTPQEAYECGSTFYEAWTDGGSGGTAVSNGTVEGNIAVPAELQW